MRDADCQRTHAVQLQAEKILRTWMREGVFAADILADYEVSALLVPTSNLSDTAGAILPALKLGPKDLQFYSAQELCRES